MALQCYQCNSETHRRCLSEERLIDKFLIECPPAKFNLSGMKPTPFCSKMNQYCKLPFQCVGVYIYSRNIEVFVQFQEIHK